MWPRSQTVFVRRPVKHDAGDEAVPEREAVVGRWGFISAMTKADGQNKAGKLSTFNARSETALKIVHFRRRLTPGAAHRHPGQLHL